MEWIVWERGIWRESCGIERWNGEFREKEGLEGGIWGVRDVEIELKRKRVKRVLRGLRVIERDSCGKS